VLALLSRGAILSICARDANGCVWQCAALGLALSPPPCTVAPVAPVVPATPGLHPAAPAWPLHGPGVRRRCGVTVRLRWRPLCMGPCASATQARWVQRRGVEGIEGSGGVCNAHLALQQHRSGAQVVAWRDLAPSYPSRMQCFSSEAWGGRSANRGQCAQACRKPYGGCWGVQRFKG
jgi:hypothetical protein